MLVLRWRNAVLCQAQAQVHQQTVRDGVSIDGGVESK